MDVQSTGNSSSSCTELFTGPKHCSQAIVTTADVVTPLILVVVGINLCLIFRFVKFQLKCVGPMSPSARSDLNFIYFTVLVDIAAAVAFGLRYAASYVSTDRIPTLCFLLIMGGWTGCDGVRAYANKDGLTIEKLGSASRKKVQQMTYIRHVWVVTSLLIFVALSVAVFALEALSVEKSNVLISITQVPPLILNVSTLVHLIGLTKSLEVILTTTEEAGLNKERKTEVVETIKLLQKKKHAEKQFCLTGIAGPSVFLILLTWEHITIYYLPFLLLLAFVQSCFEVKEMSTIAAKRVSKCISKANKVYVSGTSNVRNSSGIVSTSSK